MTPYRQGLHREKLAAGALRRDGYVVVESRGSRGPADLVALKRGEVLMVQVKKGDAPLRGEWWNELWEAAGRAGAVPLVADVPARGRVRLRRILGRHVPRSQYWPLQDFTTDQAAEL